jgi:predicted HicB family RNase H-like nuclease
MKNIMEIGGYKASVQYDPEIKMFRGEFIGLNGGADFYATTVEGLNVEGRKSLQVFLDMCAEDGVEPRREYTGRFNLRIPPILHERVIARAKAEGKSVNAWMVEIIKKAA